MTWEKIECTLEGISPTVMNNGQTADPLNPFAIEIKKLSQKPKKTDDDWARLWKIQYLASFYLDDQKRPYWPEDNLSAWLLSAAGTTRGLKKKLESGGLLIPEAHAIIYEGPTEPESLYADPRFVLRAMAVNGTGKTRMRFVTCRPIFRTWKLPLTVLFEPSIVNGSDVKKLIEDAASMVGLACWRPRYGRAEVAW